MGMQPFKRFRGGLVFKAHRIVYHSTLGWRVIKKKKKKLQPFSAQKGCKPFTPRGGRFLMSEVPLQSTRSEVPL